MPKEQIFADPESKVYPLLITGTPRSGTNFIWSLLSQLQVDSQNKGGSQPVLRLAHENLKADGLVSWLHIVPGADMLWPKPTHNSKFHAIWHQVRDPLKSLTSMAFTEPLVQ